MYPGHPLAKHAMVRSGLCPLGLHPPSPPQPSEDTVASLHPRLGRGAGLGRWAAMPRCGGGQLGSWLPGGWPQCPHKALGESPE